MEEGACVIQKMPYIDNLVFAKEDHGTTPGTPSSREDPLTGPSQSYWPTGSISTGI